MRAHTTRLVSKFLVILFALCAPARFCSGYTYIQMGVDSNFLIDGGRVLFAQSDGSLTALDLETGKVLVRDRTRNYSGTLRRIPQGLLVLNDRTIALLDPARFTALWETAFSREPNIIGDDLISCDENGGVQCRNLADGRIRWSYDLPGTLEIVAESGKALVHRAATYDAEKVPATVLLDLQNGKELFHKTPTNGVHWAAAFFDGTNVYVVTGPFADKRSDYEPEKLEVWNTSGEATNSIPIPQELRPQVRDGDLFESNHKTFWQGRVYAGRESIPFERRSRRIVNPDQTNELSRTFESDYDLGDGTTFIERAKFLGGTNGEAAAFFMEIEVAAPTNHWAGVLPYLLDRGRISTVAKAAGKILIGTDLGQVECVNADTGESDWLYLFPTLRRTMSYSARSLPPTLSEADAIFRRENGSPPISGLHVINGKARAPRIIFDPDPVNPYRRLPSRLAVAWTGACLPVVILIGVHVAGWRRKWESSIPGAVAAWLTFLLFCCYLFYGRTSPETSMALKAAMLAGFGFGAWDAIHSCRRGLWIEGMTVIVTFAGIAAFLFLAVF